MEKRLYGTYAPISSETRDILNTLYDSYGIEFSEKMQREIAYALSEDNSIINQDVLFAGATSINDAYMARNTHVVKGKDGTQIKSLKLRDFKDDGVEKDIKECYNKGNFEVVISDINSEDIDKRKNFTVDEPTLYRVKDGKYAGLSFAVGKKDDKEAIFLDIANTPFDKLTKGWQESNFDPFEFAYKLVKNYPNLTEDEQASIVHVYWLASNTWAIEYKDPMGVPYGCAIL